MPGFLEVCAKLLTMIGSLEAMYRRMRRRLSRGEWMIRMFGLPVIEGAQDKPGLILLQIDGLNREEMQAAMRAGRLPFLRRLLHRHHYRLHTHYSGLPSTTPRVQAEIMYGVRTAVPAFSFLDRESGKLFRMFDAAASSTIEERLREQGEPLLFNGSSYSNIYAGGARETHFCSCDIGLDELFMRGSPLNLTVAALMNFYSFVRMGALTVIETVLAIWDCIAGIVKGHSLLKELKFVPTRVAIGVWVRELAVMGARMDIARGLPTIHINFLGYDEQAHRRGPQSAFAHWCLKGIDDAIKRIWREAHDAQSRHYDVWIYSDHGQCATTSFAEVAGQTIEEAVAVALSKSVRRDAREDLPGDYVGSSRIEARKRRTLDDESAQRIDEDSEVLVAAMGPVGHVYLNDSLTEEDKSNLAQALLRQGVPTVMAPRGKDHATIWTEDGEFELPRDGYRFMPRKLPFAEEAIEDLVLLAQHPNAGDLILSGWRRNGKHLSFAVENGSHASWSPQEITAFALLPPEAAHVTAERPYLRPNDLYRAAMHRMGRDHEPRETGVDEQTGESKSPLHDRGIAQGEGNGTSNKSAGVKVSARRENPVRLPWTPPSLRRKHVDARHTLRLMTYNVHACIGMDGRHLPERIARVIARHHPDVVALQEIDCMRARTGCCDQAATIARRLEMEHDFHPAVCSEAELYGDAIMTHLPMRMIRKGPLPTLTEIPNIEPRGALWVEIDVGGARLHLINTHLGLRPRERWVQVEALLGAQWLGSESCAWPAVLCGDFNFLPGSQPWKRITRKLRDAQLELDHHRPLNTFYGRMPLGRIDHVFVTPGLKVHGIKVDRSDLACIASDHLPLIVDLELVEATADRIAGPPISRAQ